MKLSESTSIETINRRKLTDQTKFRLNEITKIENNFNQEIKERKLNCKKLSEYVAIFDYIDKILLVLSATSIDVSIICFSSSCRYSECKFYFGFFFNYRNN